MSGTAKNWFLGLSIIISALFSQLLSLSFGQEINPEYGDLKIEGSYIEKLVFEDKYYNAVTFDNPGEIIKLPVGDYRLIQVHVAGGYSCGFRTSISDSNFIRIDENKQMELKAGASSEAGNRSSKAG